MTTTISTTLQGELAGKQMEWGRAKTAVAEAKKTLGERLVDGVDCTAASAALSTAEKKVADLELTIETLKQRTLDAKAEAARQAQQRENEIEFEVLSQLHAAGLATDEWMRQGRVLVNEQLVPLLNAARSLPNETIRSYLTTATLGFKLKLMHACRKMPGCTTGLYAQPDSPWSDFLPKPKVPNETAESPTNRVR